MNFAFSEDQERLRIAVREFLVAECPPAFVRQMLEHETAHSTDLWRKLARSGWLGVTIPRRFGGLGGSFLDLAVLFEEAGRALLPGPFFSTVLLGSAILSAAGSQRQRAEILPRLAEGSTIVTVALPETGDDLAPHAGLRARRRRNDFVLQGEEPLVPDAAGADWIVVAGRTSPARGDPTRGLTLFLVEGRTPGLGIRPVASVDATRRRYHVDFQSVVVSRARVLGPVDHGGPILGRILTAARAGLSIETVGVAERALEMSLAHARERTQFGRPVGSFQAVKHRCVDMMMTVESARSLSTFAAWAVDRKLRTAVRAAAMAKAYCGEAGVRVTGDAIQVHGGTGFTWENDLHLYYRRALANEVTLGTASLHREAVARELDF